MLDAITDRDAGSITGQRPSKPSIKAWAASLIALGVVAGGVIAGPRLLSSSTPHGGTAPPPSVAVSIPLRARSTAGSRSPASSPPSSRSSCVPRSAAR